MMQQQPQQENPFTAPMPAQAETPVSMLDPAAFPDIPATTPQEAQQTEIQVGIQQMNIDEAQHQPQSTARSDAVSFQELQQDQLKPTLEAAEQIQKQMACSSKDKTLENNTPSTAEPNTTDCAPSAEATIGPSASASANTPASPFNQLNGIQAPPATKAENTSPTKTIVHQQQVPPQQENQGPNLTINDDYADFCKTRFAQLVQANPDLATDQNQLAQILATEWSQRMITKTDIQENGGTGMIGQFGHQERQVNGGNHQQPSGTAPLQNGQVPNENLQNGNMAQNSHVANGHVTNGNLPHAVPTLGQMKNEANAVNPNVSNGQATPPPPMVDNMMELDAEPSPHESQWQPSDGKPKKWMHSYLIFVKERKTTLMKDRPNLSFKEMMQFVSACWKDISEDDRAYFNRKAEADKVRYENQMAIYKQWSSNNPQLRQAIDASKNKKSSSKSGISVTNNSGGGGPSHNSLNTNLAGAAQQQAMVAAQLQNMQNMADRQNVEQMQNPMFLIQMVAQQQQYIQILLAKQKELTNTLSQMQAMPNMIGHQAQMSLMGAQVPAMAPPQAPPTPKKQPKSPKPTKKQQQIQQQDHFGGSPGYKMFVKSLTDEIVKRNPSADKVEMQRIVNQEWIKLPDDQKQVYEKLSMQQNGHQQNNGYAMM